jgi:hypothetical protein
VLTGVVERLGVAVILGIDSSRLLQRAGQAADQL